MTSHDEYREIAASYALDALDTTERAEFEAHLATCAICRQDVADLAPVVTALGGTVEPVEPPADLKTRTLAKALGQAVPRGQVVPMRPAPAPAPGPRSNGWLIAAASLVLAAGLGAYAVSLHSEIGRLRQLAAEAYARVETLRTELAALRQDSTRLANAVNVLGAPDVIRVDLKGAAGAPEATGRAYVGSGRGLVFAANRLPPLAAGRVYQLWVIPPGSKVPQSAGVFSVDPAGASATFAVRLPPGISRPGVVAVTDEPGPSGSQLPSTPILLAGAVGD
jgi:anti-sigma-K factor RskA